MKGGRFYKTYMISVKISTVYFFAPQKNKYNATNLDKAFTLWYIS